MVIMMEAGVSTLSADQRASRPDRAPATAAPRARAFLPVEAGASTLPADQRASTADRVLATATPRARYVSINQLLNPICRSIAEEPMYSYLKHLSVSFPLRLAPDGGAESRSVQKPARNARSSKRKPPSGGEGGTAKKKKKKKEGGEGGESLSACGDIDCSLLRRSVRFALID